MGVQVIGSAGQTVNAVGSPRRTVNASVARIVGATVEGPGGSGGGVTAASVVLYCPTLTAADLTPTDGDEMFWVERTPGLTDPDPDTGLTQWTSRESFTWSEGWATDNDPTNVLILTGDDTWFPTVLAEVTPTGFTAIPVLGGQPLTLGCGGSPDPLGSVWTGWNIGGGQAGGIDPTEPADMIVPTGLTADAVRIVDVSGGGDHTTLDQWFAFVNAALALAGGLDLSTATAWLPETAYTEGDLVWSGTHYWVATTGHTSGTEWDAANWTKVAVADLSKMPDEQNSDREWSPLHAYREGELVRHDGVLWAARTDLPGADMPSVVQRWAGAGDASVDLAPIDWQAGDRIVFAIIGTPPGLPDGELSLGDGWQGVSIYNGIAPGVDGYMMAWLQPGPPAVATLRNVANDDEHVWYAWQVRGGDPDWSNYTFLSNGAGSDTVPIYWNLPAAGLAVSAVAFLNGASEPENWVWDDNDTVASPNSPDADGWAIIGGSHAREYPDDNEVDAYFPSTPDLAASVSWWTPAASFNEGDWQRIIPSPTSFFDLDRVDAEADEDGQVLHIDDGNVRARRLSYVRAVDTFDDLDSSFYNFGGSRALVLADSTVYEYDSDQDPPWVAVGVVGGDTDTGEFIYNSAGAQSGNRYNDWGDLVAALAATTAPRPQVYFEQDETIPVGAWDLGRARLNGNGLDYWLGGITVTTPNGCTFDWDAPVLDGALNLHNEGDALITKSADGAFVGILAVSGSSLSADGAPVLRVTGDGMTAGIILQHESRIFNGPCPELGLSSTAGDYEVVQDDGEGNFVAIILKSDRPIIPDAPVVRGSDATGIAVVINYTSSAARTTMTNPNYAGATVAINNSSAANLTYDPVEPADWDGPPERAGSALDELAERTRELESASAVTEWTEVGRATTSTPNVWPTFTSVPTSDRYRLRWFRSPTAAPAPSGGLSRSLTLTFDGDTTAGNYHNSGASASNLAIVGLPQGGGGFGQLELLRTRFTTIGYGVVGDSIVTNAVGGGPSGRAAAGHSYRLPTGGVPPALTTWALGASNNDVWAAGYTFILETADLP